MIVPILKSMATTATNKARDSSEVPTSASSMSIATENTLPGLRPKLSPARQVMGPAEQSVDGKLRDIAELVEGVVLFSQQGSDELSIHVPPEFSRFLLEELDKECDLGLVPTVTGTLTEAYATTVRQYLDFGWPGAGLEIIQLLEEARKNRGYAGKFFFEFGLWYFHTSVTPSMSPT
jgi:hypothetical protein